MGADVPSIAGTVGTYVESPPWPALRPHFQCVWAHAIPAGRGGPIAVLPDGCVDLLWMGDRLVVAGPDVSASVAALPPGSTITGVRFQPGAAACWLGLPMAEIVGRRIDLADLWGARASELGDRLADPDGDGSIAARLQSGLERLIARSARPPADIAAIFRWTGDDRASPRHIRDRLSISERSLRRRCRHFFGYGPKTLERILRFQHALAAMRGDPSLGLAQLAADVGYADQAHLGREAAALAGLSPGTIRRQLAVSFKTMRRSGGILAAVPATEEAAPWPVPTMTAASTISS